MKVKIVNKSKHTLPHYSTIASAGMDLRANIDESISLKPLERTIIKTCDLTFNLVFKAILSSNKVCK